MADNIQSRMISLGHMDKMGNYQDYRTGSKTVLYFETKPNVTGLLLVESTFKVMKAKNCSRFTCLKFLKHLLQQKYSDIYITNLNYNIYICTGCILISCIVPVGIHD